jgi:hypothetical protein
MKKICVLDTVMTFGEIYRGGYKVRLAQTEDEALEPLSSWGLTAIYIRLSNAASFCFEKIPKDKGWTLPPTETNTKHINFSEFTEIADKLIEICKGNILVVDESLVNETYLSLNPIAKKFFTYTKNNSVENRLFFEQAILNFEFSRAKKNFQATLVSESFLDGTSDQFPFEQKDIVKNLKRSKSNLLNLEMHDSRIDGSKTFYKVMYENNLMHSWPIHWKIQENIKNLSKFEKIKIAEEIINQEPFKVCKIFNPVKKTTEEIFSNKQHYLNIVGKIAREPAEFFENICDPNYKKAINNPTGYDHIGRGGWKNLYAYLFRILINREKLFSELNINAKEDSRKNPHKWKIIDAFRSDGNLMNYQMLTSINSADAYFYWEHSQFDQTYTNKKFVKNQNRPLALIVDPKESLNEKNIDRLELLLRRYCQSIKRTCVPYALISVPLYQSQEEILKNISDQIKTLHYFLRNDNPNHMDMFAITLATLLKVGGSVNPFFEAEELDDVIEEKIKNSEILIDEKVEGRAISSENISDEDIKFLKNHAQLTRIILQRLQNDYNPLEISPHETASTSRDSLLTLLEKLWGENWQEFFVNSQIDKVSKENYKKMIEPMSFILRPSTFDVNDVRVKSNLLIPLNNKLEEDTVKLAFKALIARANLFAQGDPRNWVIKVARMAGACQALIEKIDDKNTIETERIKAERTLQARVSELLKYSYSFLFQALAGREYFSTDKEHIYNFSNRQKEIILEHIYTNLQNLLTNKDFIPHPILYEFSV